MERDAKDIFNFVMHQNKNLIDQHIWSLRDWINKCRISVKDLSIILKKDRSYIHMLMSGRRKPSQNLMDHILVITNGKIRTIDDLIDPF